MKLERRHIKFVAVLLLVALASSFITYAATPTTTITITGGVYPGAPSYTVYAISGTYYAKDQNGYVEFNGTNFATIVNSAITSSSSTGGGVVELLTGNFYLTSGIFLQSNVHVKGQGFNTIITVADGTSDTYWGSYHALVLINGTGLIENPELSDLTLDPNNDGLGYAMAIFNVRTANVGLKIHHVNFPSGSALSGAAISLTATVGAEIYSNIITNNRIAIYAEYTNDSSIHDNYVENITNEGFYIGEYAYQNIVSNNIVKNVEMEAIELKSNSYLNTVSGNRISNSLNGIYVGGNFTSVMGNTINGGTNGIYIQSGGSSVGISVVVNSLYNQSNVGIGVEDEQGVTITGNNVKSWASGGSMGIRILNSGNNTINANIVYAGYDGIKLQNGDNNIITNNVVTKNLYFGIYETDATSDYNIFIGNSVLDNGSNLIIAGTSSKANLNYNGTSWIS